MKRLKVFLFFLTLPACAQKIELVPVVSRTVETTHDLPAEILPFLAVTLRARVAGYVDRVNVDRGSRVAHGEILVEMSAPELHAQVAEAEAQAQAATAEQLQAVAALAGAESTYGSLKKAAATPGAIAGHELELAEKQVEAAQALVRARQQSSKAAASAVDARKQMESYLRITAPFDGVVTERLVHPGALVGPGSEGALLTIEQVSRLRVVVQVPESDTAAIAQGATAKFKVAAWPEREFSGTVARVSRAIEAKTRTMAVELEVANRDGALSPGMYPTVKWPVRRAHPALFVPKSSVVTTTERTFVIRAHDGKAEWVNVKKGAADGDQVEVIGNLKPGDRVVKSANDEIRDGSPLRL
jgi:membrane fusion protein (multidrug efflux system)